MSLKNVIERLKGFSKAKWHKLGVVLNVPDHVLEDIRANRSEVYDRFSMVISYWIKHVNVKEVTWKVLWEALCSDTVAEANLGREIRDWYTEKTWRDPRLVY